MPISRTDDPAAYSGLFSVAAIRRHGLLALVIALVGGLVCLLVSFAMTPVYVAQAVLLPVKADSGLGNLFPLPSALGELATMAGVSTGPNDATEALETLESRALTERFIRDNGLLDTLVEPSWLGRIVGRGNSMSPEKKLGLAVRRFRESVVDVSEDKRTGVVHLSVFWTDPKLAANWSNRLTSLVNQHLQSRALSESKRRLDYLNAEAERTNVVGVKEAVYRVIEAEIKARMLASARSEYAFRVIDPAVAPDVDDYARPNRVAFFVIGFFLSAIATLLLRQHMKRAA